MMKSHNTSSRHHCGDRLYFVMLSLIHCVAIMFYVACDVGGNLIRSQADVCDEFIDVLSQPLQDIETGND